MIMSLGCILKLSITKPELMEITFQRIYDITGILEMMTLIKRFIMENWVWISRM